MLWAENMLMQHSFYSPFVAKSSSIATRSQRATWYNKVPTVVYFHICSCIFDIQPDQPGEHKSYYEKHTRIAIRLAQHSRACYHRLWPSISDAEPGGQGKHLNPLIDFDSGRCERHDKPSQVCHGVPWCASLSTTGAWQLR